ncbi:lytic transglycosylase domain-containing protein [Burkholderia cenocepacia]|uniref:lytic transglycosylase domain-containing protein n=1 Tax=Burkholderia cenocepacia TaxID=95486 RepID=UPI0020A00E80|nr:lytic transglycosylase domain-containing protein [Burkholderia cenocepacia]MCO8332984.1 lytic transglycosylase domain-containing protein [Burkholderia cenocepacia]MCO8340484.1 lytic transglycosylase domain-containing protein [Burkholderia cenocepacia]MCO8347770.1 lytic transglycosylase domain-containing protein [Burkholderia cenocepacia]MCO8360836.1 lytic transglycosylase domain-containing protein [Burkholderia cenocepacia]
MANKPIINIDVNAEQFKAFYELYEQFEAKVASMPKEWQQIDTSMRRSAATAKSLTSGIQSSTEAQRQFNIMAREGLHTMSKMAKEAANVGRAVFDIGKWLLKFGAIGGGIAGLGGILGAISLRDLAHSAVTEQRGARGVGLTPGQYKAFGMDFGRFLDPSILSHVADAQNSYQGRVWLGLATGLGAQSVANQGPDQLAMRLATRAHDWWTKTPSSQRTAENLAAAGFTQSGLTLEDVRRLGNTPLSELNAARSQYSRDQRSLNVSNGTTQAWYEFDRQITLAGRALETSLTNRLVELAPSLRAFVTTLTKDADQLINDIFTPKNLKAVSDGITGMTAYLGSPTFQQDMKDFAGLIGLVANAIRKAARFLGIDTSSSSNAEVGDFDFGSGPNDWNTGGISGADKALGYTRHALTMPSNPEAVLAGLDRSNGLPAGTLSAIWDIESKKGKNLVGPLLGNGDQAIGDFQFTSPTWNEWGKGGDRFNFSDQAGASGRYMQSLMKRYGGDIRKALAAYNWGMGNLDKDISKNGGQWESHLPAETRKYIAQVAGEVAKRNAVKVSVQVSNNTSARVAVQANAASPGR